VLRQQLSSTHRLVLLHNPYALVQYFTLLVPVIITASGHTQASPKKKKKKKKDVKAQATVGGRLYDSRPSLPLTGLAKARHRPVSGGNVVIAGPSFIPHALLCLTPCPELARDETYYALSSGSNTSPSTVTLAAPQSPYQHVRLVAPLLASSGFHQDSLTPMKHLIGHAAIKWCGSLVTSSIINCSPRLSEIQ
jgi:hypothetical protein